MRSCRSSAPGSSHRWRTIFFHPPIKIDHNVQQVIWTFAHTTLGLFRDFSDPLGRNSDRNLVGPAGLSAAKAALQHQAGEPVSRLRSGPSVRHFRRSSAATVANRRGSDSNRSDFETVCTTAPALPRKRTRRKIRGNASEPRWKLNCGLRRPLLNALEFREEKIDMGTLETKVSISTFVAGKKKTGRLEGAIYTGFMNVNGKPRNGSECTRESTHTQSIARAFVEKRAMDVRRDDQVRPRQVGTHCRHWIKTTTNARHPAVGGGCRGVFRRSAPLGAPGAPGADSRRGRGSSPAVFATFPIDGASARWRQRARPTAAKHTDGSALMTPVHVAYKSLLTVLGCSGGGARSFPIGL